MVDEEEEAKRALGGKWSYRKEMRCEVVDSHKSIKIEKIFIDFLPLSFSLVKLQGERGRKQRERGEEEMKTMSREKKVQGRNRSSLHLVPCIITTSSLYPEFEPISDCNTL